MRKSALFATFCSLLFLAACNTNDNTQNDDTPVVEDVERGVDDAMDDTRDAIDDTVDTLDPDGRNGNGQMNESTIDNNNGSNPNVNVPNGSSGTNGENGMTAPGAPSANEEGIIEDREDRKDKDQIDNR